MRGLFSHRVFSHTGNSNLHACTLPPVFAVFYPSSNRARKPPPSHHIPTPFPRTIFSRNLLTPSPSQRDAPKIARAFQPRARTPHIHKVTQGRLSAFPVGARPSAKFKNDLILCPKALYTNKVPSDFSLDERPVSTTNPGDVWISSQTA